MKRCLAILILLALLPVSVQAGSAPHTVKTNSVPVYCTDDRDIRSAQDMVLIPDHPLYYLDGAGDLPYADLKDFVGLMNSVAAFDARDPFGGEIAPKEDYAFSIDEERHVFTCTFVPRQSHVIIDFDRGTVTYTCMDTFGKAPDHSPFEIQTNELDFLERIYDPKVSRLGGERTLDLLSYGIPMIAQDGKYLLPLHTAFDLMMWVADAPMRILCCNGAAVFIGPRDSMFGWSDAPSELGQIYFSQPPALRSPELARYGYNELCLILDHFYGLKDSHHIGSFRSFFKNNGYEEKLLSPDPAQADQALLDTIRFALNDFHSNFNFSSWMAGPEEELTYEGEGLSSGIFDQTEAAFRKAFGDSGLDPLVFYSESGDTAYLTLYAMSTSVTSERFYSMDPGDPENIAFMDAVEEILYAHGRIFRENSPIKNVVLDLSHNPGGDVNSAACALSWFLGEGYVTIANSFSGGLGVGQYRADIDRDRQFTDGDTLRGKKKLFCLISPETFSSANLTAAMLKMSGEVTMIGRTTKGGSGIVTPAVTGWDTIFTLSGFRTVVTVKNGSWYDADTGVAPDVYLSDPALFYDRDRLTGIIDALP